MKVAEFVLTRSPSKTYSYAFKYTAINIYTEFKISFQNIEKISFVYYF